MRLIGVIDLAGGAAVHARGGRRDAYTAVRSALVDPADWGNPIALARAYLRLAVPEIYLADLDAIAGAPPAFGTITAIASLGAPLWVDAGARSAEVSAGCEVARTVVGLETMRSWDDLSTVPGAAFSLDLRSGRPLAGRPWAGAATPATIARRAVDAGASAVILLDLARVGSMVGLDWVTVEAVRASTRGVELVVGGGVRDEIDLERLVGLGCDGALVATALHEQRIHRTSW